MNRYYRSCMPGAEEVNTHGNSCTRNNSSCTHNENTSCAPTESSCDLLLAIAHVPSQPFRNLYEAEKGWSRGTIFADLDKPYEGGCCR